MLILLHSDLSKLTSIYYLILNTKIYSIGYM
nr:MAG TPA: hypothetical protein [Bacteriophage sp.]